MAVMIVFRRHGGEFALNADLITEVFPRDGGTKATIWMVGQTQAGHEVDESFVEVLRLISEGLARSGEVTQFERWVSQGPMKGDGKKYLDRGVWPRFRDINDLGRMDVLLIPHSEAEPELREVRPAGWYWFTVGLARQHYSKVEDPDFLFAQAALA